jgi:phosphohistidine phosphatase
MKILLILRHAKSSWDEADMNDHERPLNKRGKRDAPRVGRLLRQEDLVPDLVISSTARRAKKTAEAVIEESGYGGELILERELYAAPPEAYVDILSHLETDPGTVLVVGHNPGLEELVTELTGEDVVLKTAALAQVELPIDHWSQVRDMAKGKLVQVWYTRENQ